MPRSGRRLSIIQEDGRPALVRQGIVFDHGLFGGGVEDAVRGVPAAEEAARTYHHRMVTGFLVGMGGLVCSMIAFGYATDAGLREDEDASAELAVSAGCFVGSMAGLIYMASGPPYMYDAINIYNDSVEVPPPYPYGPPRPPAPPGPLAPPGTAGTPR